ncbi:MAG: hypothetical protein WCO98_01630 [bacterium]
MSASNAITATVKAHCRLSTGKMNLGKAAASADGNPTPNAIKIPIRSSTSRQRKRRPTTRSLESRTS